MVQSHLLATEARNLYEGMTKADDSGSISIDWSGLALAVAPSLTGVYAQSGDAAYNDATGVSWIQVNDRAAQYARERAAELVGMKWVDGNLVNNPSAEWSITATTREEIRVAIEEALTEGLTPSELASRIEALVDDGARAESIARTELAMAQGDATLSAWRDSGVVGGKEWLADADACDICLGNEEDGTIGLDDEFSSGDDSPPAHPNCVCDVTAALN